MTTYRLASNGLCHTPGILAWAMNGYAFPRDRARLTAVFVDGYGLPKPAAKALLSGAAPHTIEGDSVVFTWPLPRLTQSAVRADLKARDVTFRRTEWREYRVNLKGAGEATAYYTTDLDDALATGLHMADTRDAAALVPYRPFFPPMGAARVAALAELDAYRGRA